MKKVKTIGFLFLAIIASGQEMKQGYILLYEGQFEESEIFFQKILENFPENKTALICYARAVGLSGEPQRAMTAILKAKAQYPDDTEVLLNEGEAWLWMNNPNKAIESYNKVLQIDSLNAIGLLGLANANASLHNYALAIVNIEKALSIDPTNKSFNLSLKYISLGMASQLIDQQKFGEAKNILVELDSTYLLDIDITASLLQLYINQGSPSIALKLYQQRQEHFCNDLDYLITGSLIHHLNHKNKQAKQLAYRALESINSTNDPSLKRRVKERYAQSLIWNRHNKEFESFLNNLQLERDQLWLKRLEANYYDYKVKPKKSLLHYKSILETDPNDYGGLLGSANALIALDRPSHAVSYINSAYANYGSRKDLEATIRKITSNQLPDIESSYTYSEDEGNNQANEYKLSSNIPLNSKTKLLLDYKGRWTTDISVNPSTSLHSLGLGLRYKVLPHLYTSFKIKPTIIPNTRNETRLLTSLSLEAKPRLLDLLSVSYHTSTMDYNTSLIKDEIIENNFIVSYNFFTLSNLGWYNEYQRSQFSDGNQKRSLYSSLYYQWRVTPLVKTGISYQWLTFEASENLLYFSPDRFTSNEIFIEMYQKDKITSANQFTYRLFVAGGLQDVGNHNHQSSLRYSASAGYKLKHNLYFNLEGKWSNVSSSNTSGQSYFQIAINIGYRFNKGPFDIMETK